MKNSKFITIFLLLVTLVNAKELDKVSLQLQWLDQFQFAGYYMAKEKGFYKDVGLDVELKKFNSNVSLVDEVLEGRVTYGIGRSSLIVERSRGKKVVLLASIFQSSPLILLATKESNVKSVKDFVGKKVMIRSDVLDSVSLVAMEKHSGIEPQDLVQIRQTFNINDFINNKTDLMSAYISNEPFSLQKRGIKYTVFDPKSYGFDFYSDILFTSENEVKKYNGRYCRFRNASLRGWEYAFEHIDETVTLILKKYNTQNKSKEALIYEAKELKKLAYCNGVKLGNISKAKIQRIYDIYNVMGYIKDEIDMDEFIIFKDKAHTLNLTKEELQYLKNKKEITVCVKKDYLPYESFKDGEFIGIGSDFLKLITTKLSIPTRTMVSQDGASSFEMLKSGKCDIKPFFPNGNNKLLPYNRTKTYFNDKIALVTRIEQPYIYDMNILNGKKAVIVEGFEQVIQQIKIQYPNLELHKVKDVQTALKLVASNKFFGYIGKSLTSSYGIQKEFSSELKIVNNFETLEFGFGVLKSEKILLCILDKAINSITQDEKQIIFNRWIATTVERAHNHIRYFQLMAVFIFILTIILYFYNKQTKLKNSLKSMVKDRTLALEAQNNELKIAIKNFEDLIDAVAEIIIISDENYNIIDINLAGVKILKANNKYEIIGKNMLEFVPEEELEKVLESLKKDVVLALEMKIKIHNEKIIPVLATGKNILRDTQKIRITTLLDTSELKQKDEQLLQQSKLAQMGDMISMIAHQWRQPLNAISATGINLSLLSSMDILKREKVKESSEFIQDQCQKMSSTIDTFMNFVKPAKESKAFRLSHTVDAIMQIMGTQLLNHNIKVTIEVKNENIAIVGYEDLLEQVIINILSNARDAFKNMEIANKYIDITIDMKKNTPTILIEDNAGGIPEDIREKIFNPYFTTKEQGTGTGIGLYMSLDIMKKSFNGDLKYKATADGSCFEIICGKNKIK